MENTAIPELPRTAPTTFTLPGYYGRGPLEYVVGQGRLARPRYRFTTSLSVGYDDNVFQTPTKGVSVKDREVQVLVAPGTPDTQQEVAVPSGDPLVPDSTKIVVVPGTAPQFRTQRIPGFRAAERIGSQITRAEAEWNVQIANRRNLFTLDFQGGASYYWDRPGDQTEYTGSLAMLYLRKLTGRLQVTGALNASYQTQPDFSQPNTPTTNGGGSYLSASAKADLSYRLTPRFSSVTSIAYNAVHYMEQQQSSGDYGETTFGTELRYLFSPRLTLLGELRYSSSGHQDNPELDTTTYFLLTGGELRLSRRFTATLRVGEALQTFSESGQKSSSPYGEFTLAYLLARGTSVSWNARYGYEESGSANSETVVGRTGLTLTQIFSPRFQGSLSLNFLRNTTSSTGQIAVLADDGTATGDTRSVDTESVQDTLDATLAFHYILSRQWSFNLSYSYTMVAGPTDFSDYYRQRVFVGAEYLF